MSERQTNDAMMSCADIEAALDTYVRSELEATDESRFALHLLECSDCAAKAALAERVEVELAALPAFDAPAELIARLKAAARPEMAPVVPLVRTADRRWPSWSRRLAAAAALVAGLAVGWSQLDREPQPSAAEIAAAEREARYALALVARIGRRASEEVRDEVLVERVAVPVMKSMSRQFGRTTADKSGGLKS